MVIHFNESRSNVKCYKDGNRFDKVLGAVFRHAAMSALLTTLLFAAANRILVAPRRPHAPFTGSNIPGSSEINSACCSGVSFTIPHLLSGHRVANIFPATLKSGCFMCSASVVSGRLKASLRNSAAFIELMISEGWDFNLRYRNTASASLDLLLRRRSHSQQITRDIENLMHEKYKE